MPAYQKISKLRKLEESLKQNGKPTQRNIKDIVANIIQERAPLGARQSYLNFCVLYILTYIPVPLPIPNLRKKVKVFMRGKVKL